MTYPKQVQNAFRRLKIVDAGDGMIDVHGDLLVDFSLSLLPKIHRVYGSFRLVNCHESLVGCPLNVTELFDCPGNKLTSLEGAPLVVGTFNCSYNRLVSLRGLTQSIGAGLDLSHNELASLEGSPREVRGYFDCGYNRVTSLVGGPASAADYYCYNNPLESLDGAPTHVGNFIIHNTPLSPAIISRYQIQLEMNK